MLTTLVALMAAPAHAETLPVELGDKTATITTPSSMGVQLSLKAAAEGDTTQVTWDNQESSALSFLCTEEGKTAEDTFVDQVVLQVADKKWALAAGSNVSFTCAAGKVATVTDIHDQKIGTFKGGLTVSVVKAKSHSSR